MRARVQDVGYGAYRVRQRRTHELQAPLGSDQRAACLLLLPSDGWVGKHARAELEVSSADELLASDAPASRGTAGGASLQASWVMAVFMIQERSAQLTIQPLYEEEPSMAAQITPPETISLNSGYLRAKRALDILFTLLILIPLCLIVVIVGLLICFDSEGPPFFSQKRIGVGGTEFNMLKFRSMYVNQDDALHRAAIKRYIQGKQLSSNVEGGLSYKLDNDPRITPIGRFIRRASIDELPQFFNVLRGEMTLVGPRPPLPYEVELYRPQDWLRHVGKPGLTGYWQVYGRSQVTFQEMVELDIAYLQRQSLWEDIKLIALTVPVMITGRGGA